MIFKIVIFAFQQNRTELAYDKLFTFINNLVLETTGNPIDTKLCVVDNERACINSLRKIIDFDSQSRDLRLCAFHVNQGFRSLFRGTLCQEITINSDYFNTAVYEIYVQVLKIYLMPTDVALSLLNLIGDQISDTKFSTIKSEHNRIRDAVTNCIQKVSESVKRNNRNTFVDTTNNRFF